MLREKSYKLLSLFMCLVLKMVVTDKAKWQKSSWNWHPPCFLQLPSCRDATRSSEVAT